MDRVWLERFLAEEARGVGAGGDVDWLGSVERVERPMPTVGPWGEDRYRAEATHFPQGDVRSLRDVVGGLPDLLSSQEFRSWMAPFEGPSRAVGGVIEGRNPLEAAAFGGPITAEVLIERGVDPRLALALEVAFVPDPTGASRALDLLPLMGVLVGLPKGTQRLLADFLPDFLKDAEGLPLRQLHGEGNLPILPGDVRMTGVEGHGHTGTFVTPDIGTARGYQGRWRVNRAIDLAPPSRIVDMMVVPERPWAYTSSDPNDTTNFFAGVAPKRVRLEDEPGLAQLRDDVANAAESVMALLPKHLSYGGLVSQNLRDLSRVFGGEDVHLMNAFQTLEDVTRNVNDIVASARAQLPETLLSYIEPRLAELNNAVNTFGEFDEATKFGTRVTNFARKAGFDAGFGAPKSYGEWIGTTPIEGPVRPPEEIASYQPQVYMQGGIPVPNPETNIIYPVDLENVENFLRRKGVSEDALAAARATEIPDTRYQIGNMFVPDKINLSSDDMARVMNSFASGETSAEVLSKYFDRIAWGNIKTTGAGWDQAEPAIMNFAQDLTNEIVNWNSSGNIGPLMRRFLVD